MRKKILVLCHDTVGTKMAGPGIRYKNIANQIASVGEVSLGVFSTSKQSAISDGSVVINSSDESYKSVFDHYDVIFAQWLSLGMLNYAKATGTIVIIDLYAPVPIEYLASLGFSRTTPGSEKDIEFSGILETYKNYLTLGDFFVCSNERQRDFWLGFMTSANLLRPSNFIELHKMDKIALCPMGISSDKPVSSSLALRKRLGLSEDDFVLLWTGGIWDWFDACTVIEAVKNLNNPRVKLVFMGTQHPNSKVSEMSESKLARKLVKKLGMENKSVFFLDGWVDYEKRVDYLLDANIAIYADKDSVETRFSHRTRVLDHIWTELPTICSKGDYLSTIVDNLGMGVVVEHRTSKAFSEAIDDLYKNPVKLSNIKSNIRQNKDGFTWEVLSSDLLKFIKKSKSKKMNVSTTNFNPKHIDSSRIKLARKRTRNALRVLLGRVDV